MKKHSEIIKKGWITRRRNGNDIPYNKLPVPPKQELEKLYIVERNSTWEIAPKYKVSQMQIRRWLKYWNIPRRSYKENKMPTRKGGKHNWGDKISKSMIGNTNMPTKENHWNWKGGLTPLGKQIRNSAKYKGWRKRVFERDGWTCQECGKRGVYLEADHIKPFSKICAEYKIETLDDAMGCKELWQAKNGRTLCRRCHKLIGWQFFKESNPKTINNDT